ncbi:MAG: hypothetical protein PGN15_09080 [Aeromicrobium erythreum]
MSRALPPQRVVVIQADDEPVSVVFEMLGETVELPPWGELRLVLRGPETAELRVGYGVGGLSVFRDAALEVEVRDNEGRRIDVGLF